MKWKKTKKTLLWVTVLALLIPSCMVSAKAGSADSQDLSNEFINLAKVNNYTVNSGIKLPNVDVDTISITKNGKTFDGLVLSSPGDYKVELTTNDATYKYYVYAYQRGDANIDGVIDIRDLVALKRSNVYTEISATYGADYNGDKQVTDTDYRFLIRSLLFEPLMVPEVGDMIDNNIKISDVEISNSSFSIEVKNTSKVWDIGKNSFIDFTFFDSSNNEEVVQKVNIGKLKAGASISHTFALSAETSSVKITDFDFDYWSKIIK